MLRRWPIAIQVMALVALAILVSAGAMIAITLGGPPPRQPPLKLEQLAEAMTIPRLTEFVFEDPRQTDNVDGAVDEMVELPRVTERLAPLLDVPVEELRFYSEQPQSLRDDMLFGDFIVARALGDGGWELLERGPDQSLRRWQILTISTIVGVLIVLLLLAWLAARRITRPIQDLALAARSSRAGMPWRSTVGDGPPEVLDAVSALDEMHARNLEHSRQRMTMLAAISHDIGTPLARLAFRIEGLPDRQRDAAMADVETMRRLLTDSLTLAKGWTGKVETCNLSEICSELAARERETGNNVEFASSGPVFLTGNPLSLQRMVQNLLDNALRYGGSARLSVDWDDQFIRLSVEDDGPGFPDIASEELLRPFVRGEASRNMASGGSGLGLAIVAQVVAQHGGTIELGKGVGGARVTILLPTRR